MLPFDFYRDALPYDEFLSTHGTPADRARWDRTRAAVAITPEQTQLLGLFTRKTHVLALAGAWCGDCSGQCPIFEAFSAAAPVIEVRYLDRDAHPEAQKELRVNGGDRVPVAVFYSEDGFEVARYGERPLAAYRRLARGLVPQLPQPATADPLADLTADWLREFERVQWVLRLSPRLRRLHGD